MVGFHVYSLSASCVFCSGHSSVLADSCPCLNISVMICLEGVMKLL